MGYLAYVPVAIVLMIVPALAGRYAGKKAFLLLSIPPTLILFFGLLSWNSDRQSSNEETADWAGLWLVFAGFGIALEVLAAIGFAVGRVFRQRAERKDFPETATPLAASPATPFELEATSREASPADPKEVPRETVPW